MEVHVLIEEGGHDYEGSSSSVLGVFSKWEDAFAEVRKKLPKAKPVKADFGPGGEAWFWDAPRAQARAEGYDFLGWSIDVHEVK